MPLQLLNTSDASSNYLRILLIGEAGSGKTKISATLPSPLVVTSEGLMLSLAEDKVPYIKLKGTADLWELMAALEQEPAQREATFGIKVSSVNFDTIDEIQRMFVRERLASKNQDTLQRDDYAWIAERMREVLARIRNLDMHVVATCHVRTFTPDDGPSIQKPHLVGAVADEVSSYFDIVALLGSTNRFDAETNTMNVQRHLTTVRTPATSFLKDHSGKIPHQFEINFVDDFTRLYNLVHQVPAIDPTILESSSDVDALRAGEPAAAELPAEAAS